MKKETEHDVQIRFNKNEWGEFKALCVENGMSPHGLIRKFVKTYVIENGKNFKKTYKINETY